MAEIEEAFSKFDPRDLFTQKDTEMHETCKRFLGIDKLMIQLTSAQLIFNSSQHSSGKILTFDMRSCMNYHQVHLKDSISFPIDLCDENFFINWDINHIQSTAIKNKEKLSLFKNRKRLFINVIAAENDVQMLLFKCTKLFKTENLAEHSNLPGYHLADVRFPSSYFI